MIGSEFVSEVALMLGRNDLDSNILNWINWGMYYLDRQCDFKGLRTRVKFPFVVGQTEYSFPTDMKYPTSLTLLDHLMEAVSVSIVTNLITVTTTIPVGTRVMFLSTDPPPPLAANVFYYVIYVSATTIKLALTSALATAGTAIVLTDVGTTPYMMEVYNGSDSRKLEYILEADFVEQVPDITERSSDKPSIYIDKGDVFEIGNPIDEVLCGELVYWKWQDALTTETAPEVSYIEDLICLAATIFGWRALEEVQKKADAIAELDKLLGSHMKVLSRHPDEFLSDRGFRSSEIPMRANMGAYGYKYPGVKAR